MREALNDFDEIRPYRDDEVAAVLRRLARDPSLQRDLARYSAPSLSRWAPPLARWLVGNKLRAAFAQIDSVDSFQQALAGVFQRMIDDTTDGFTVSGIERLEPDLAHLFISNHRDITLDSGFMNLALFRAGHPTTRMAIGDNLLRTGYAADVMRLNKGFVVQRGKKGAKLAFASMSQTSRYIRHSLETGHSVWTAQREGRAKDGRDLTDPALIKMLSLAYRKDIPDIGRMIERLSIVPVAVSYELDPCDELKAHELLAIAEHGSYRKAPGEDLRSIITGVTGRKGRVHLSVGPALSGSFNDAESVAAEIDRQIALGYRLFPTHFMAARLAGLDCPMPDESSKRLRDFEQRLAATAPALRAQIVAQYANPVARALELGIVRGS
jgi:1-acyl-sn-glycerol-3-phosphate acyltransferase